jgi:hypothetical protein
MVSPHQSFQILTIVSDYPFGIFKHFLDSPKLSEMSFKFINMKVLQVSLLKVTPRNLTAVKMLSFVPEQKVLFPLIIIASSNHISITITEILVGKQIDESVTRSLVLTKVSKF